MLYEREQEILDLPGDIKQENNLCNSIEFLATILRDIEKQEGRFRKKQSKLWKNCIQAIMEYLCSRILFISAL